MQNDVLDQRLLSELADLVSLINAPFGGYLRVGIITGSGSFDDYSARVCTEAGLMLAAEAAILAVALTEGGLNAVAAFCGAAGETGDDRCFLFKARSETRYIKEELPLARGRLLVAGDDVEERRILFAAWAEFYLLVGGGSSANFEANHALRNGAVVLPVPSTGGAAAGATFSSPDAFYGHFPAQETGHALVKKGIVTAAEWSLLCKKAEPAVVAQVVRGALQRILAAR